VNSLNAAQKRHLLSELKHADTLLSDIEAVLAASASKAAFPKYKQDLSPRQIKVIQDYIARLRTQMLRAAEGFDLDRSEPAFGSLHSIRTILTFIDIAFEELRPKYMRGYGAVPESAAPELNGLADELQGIASRLDAYLAAGLGQDIPARLERLAQAGTDTSLLSRLEQVISDHGLVEFRPALSIILERLENNALEIALFGRVSSGKSSLLNRILGVDVLPVGVNPITAVPTRIVYGPAAVLTVWFADRRPERCDISRLAEFAAEQHNPANARHVTKIVVELPASGLCEGVTFVDTPGLGSLAAAGALETRAYLPRCDLGVVLVDAGSTLTQEDIGTIHALYEAGIPASVLLSKADLLGPGDLSQAEQYIAAHIASELGFNLRIHPVSVIGEHAALLDRWVEQEIRPLYSRRRELAAESVRRKLGALREAVEAALRARLQRAGRSSAAGAEVAKKIESRLRRAAGKLQQTRKTCEKLAGEAASLANSVVARAAVHALRTAGIDAPAAVGAALDEVTGEITKEIRQALETLAKELAGALESTAADLGSPGWAEEGLDTIIREMPRPDLGQIHLDLRVSVLSKFAKNWEIRRMQSRIRNQIGSRIDAALDAYSRLLESWSRKTIAEMQRRFDAQADSYRAEAGRIAGAEEASAQDPEAIRRSLESIQAPVAAGHRE
jgi:GTP-binding protein EngB required for normal cell division